jgi:hypothetical protein
LPFYEIGRAPAAVRHGAAAGAGPAAAPPDAVSLPVDPLGGLDSQPFSFSPTQTLVTTPNGDYYDGDAGTLVVPYEPVIPLSTLDVTVPGKAAHGILITSTAAAPLESSDEQDFGVAFSRPVVDTSANEPAGTYANVSFPDGIATLRSLGTVDLPEQSAVFATGAFFGGNTPGVGVMRRWTTISGEVLYSPSTDFTPPVISSTDAVADGSNVSFTVQASDADTEVQFVYVLYRDASGNWQAKTLTRGADGWTGTAPASGTPVEYFVQAADINGNVGVGPNRTRFSHGIVSIALDGTRNAAGDYTGPVQVTTSSTTGSPREYSLDSASAVSYTGPFTVATNGFHIVSVSAADGSQSSASFTIASVPPLITLTTPAAAARYSLGAAVDALYTCADAGSGVTSCTGTAANGDSIDTSTLGAKSFTVTATNSVGVSSVFTQTYTVTAPPPTLTLPADRTVEATGPQGAIISYDATAHDAIDGPVDVVCSPPSGSTFTLGGTTVTCSATNAHDMTAQASFKVTVVDTTAPTITAAATTSPNAAGWYRNNVVVRFTCTDSGSGIPAGACPADETLTAEGDAVAASTPTVTDVAGNTSAPSNPITVRIDRTAPALSPSVSPSIVAFGGTATAAANATDLLSGVASQSCDAVSTSSPGEHSVSCTATDGAGNTTSATASYTVASPLTVGKTTCRGAFSGSGRQVVVPAGSTCTLVTGTHVSLSVQVQPGGMLDAEDVSIGGSLQATDALWIEVDGSTVGGNLQVQGLTGSPASGHNTLCNVTVGGNAAIENNGPGAPIDIGSSGDCNGGPGLAIDGYLRVQNNDADVTVGGNSITEGYLQVQGNRAKVTVIGNNVSGNIQVYGNTVGVDSTLSDNTAGGACQLQGNNPKIVGSGNTAGPGRVNTCDRTA